MKTEKLEAMEARYLSIEDQLSDPSVIANQNKWRELSKEHAELSEIVSKFREYKKVMQQCQDARDILGDNTMKDLHDLAKEDLKTGEEEAERLEKEIHILPGRNRRGGSGSVCS